MNNDVKRFSPVQKRNKVLNYLFHWMRWKCSIPWRYKPFSPLFQIWVYGNSFEAFLVAVVNPRKEALEQWAQENAISKDFNSLCEDARAKSYILEELSKIAKEKKVFLFLFFISLFLSSYFVFGVFVCMIKFHINLKLFNNYFWVVIIFNMKYFVWSCTCFKWSCLMCKHVSTSTCIDVLKFCGMMKYIWQLKGFEFIKGVHLDPIPFDMERDLITPTYKKKRPQLLKFYQVQVVKFSGFHFTSYWIVLKWNSLHKLKVIPPPPPSSSSFLYS